METLPLPVSHRIRSSRARGRWLPVLCSAWLVGSAGLSAAADHSEELRLRDGKVLKGQFIEGDKQTIVFRTGAGLETFPKKDVRALVFEREAPPPAGEFPPGFSARPPHALKHVTTYRRITQNRATEEKQFEPDVVGISGDGAKIVFWNHKTGFHSLNADGSGRKPILARKDETDRYRAEWGGRFQVSHNGRHLFWQGYQSAAIRRIDTDGSDEKLLVRAGAEYEAFRLREKAGRIFFSQRGGIFSIDTEGRGDYREIVTNITLGKLWEVSSDHTMLGRFDVSEDGKRIAFVVGGYPKAKAMQLMAINADGSGLRRIAETETHPWALTMSPNGEQIVFWQPERSASVVHWDGTGLKAVPFPPWDVNGGGFQHLNRFSADGRLFMYHGYEGGGGPQLMRLDGTERHEPLGVGPWSGSETALWHGMYPPTFTADLRRFVSITQYHPQLKPRQILVGEINPHAAPGLPVLSDIEFPAFLSTNPQVPQHRGTLKVKITPGASPVERVQFLLAPVTAKTRNDPNRWRPNLGWDALQGDRQLRDDGKNGDEKAGDGIYTSDNLSPHPGDYRLPEGKYLLRIVAHDDQNAVVVDVAGVEIK